MPVSTILNRFVADIKQDYIGQASVQALLVQILQASTSPKSINQLQVATLLAKEVAATSLHRKTFHSNMLIALSNHDVQNHVNMLLATESDSVGEHWNFPCPNANTLVRQTCLSATISMLLNILLVDSSGSTPHTKTSLGIALVEKQRQLYTPMYECAHVRKPQAFGRKSKYAHLLQHTLFLVYNADLHQ